MKKMLSICFLLFTVCLYSQHFGNFKVQIEGSYNKDTPVYYQWLSTGSSYIMKFKQNTVGFSNLVIMSEAMLYANDMSHSEAEFSANEIGSDVVNQTEEELSTSIFKGNSKINLKFERNGQTLSILADKATCEIVLTDPYAEVTIKAPKAPSGYKEKDYLFVTCGGTFLHSGPTSATDPLTLLVKNDILTFLRYEGNWIYVYNNYGKSYGWVDYLCVE